MMFGVFLSSGCSFNPPLQLAQITAEDRASLLLPVPFFPQEEFQCGPAALAGLLSAGGVESNPDELAAQVYLPGRQGSLQIEMKAATRRAGRIAYEIDPEVKSLIAQLGKGRPVLVFQNLGTPHFPIWHYAVLVGFDVQRNEVILNSGLEREKVMSAPAFLRTWDWAGRWAMVALRPGEWPAEPNIDRYLGALADFGSTATPADAERAWRAALERWPDDTRPYLALGNLSYSEGDLHAAAGYYRGGLALDAFDAALSNNLASVLGETGCPRSGELLLENAARAVAEDSGWKSVFEQTLSELAVRPGKDAAECANFPD
ncbi:MAG: PA2778 family cysteine peptidase [Xanthomonadales bacterium]|nr:PA2778 family cysteine peptidase [Xanthomonadales bacterium]